MADSNQPKDSGSIAFAAEGLASLEHEFAGLQCGGYAHSMGVFLIILAGTICGSVALSVILGASKSSTLVRIGHRSTLVYAHLSICCYDSRKMQQSRKWSYI